MLIARRFIVSGRVQGVGFRFFVREAAQVEGVNGWVTNLPDGRVEVHAEGDREAIQRLEWQIRRGPRGARVDDMIVDEVAPSGRPSGFHVNDSRSR
jgi:acylphosphatase